MSGCTIYGSPWRTRLLDDVRERLFAPARPDRPGRLGARAQLIPLRDDTGASVPILGDPGTLAFLRAHGDGRGWRLATGADDVPALHPPGGGRVAFKPGGQIEYATPARETAGEVAADLGRVLPPLVSAAAEAGIRLVGCGIDPVNPLDRARLLLSGERHAAIHRYLAGIGDAGPRAMLQSAALHVDVGITDPLGTDAELRWRVLNSAAPYLTAIFANSAAYAGRHTGFASFRARQWRLLDERRTGLLGRTLDPVAEYTDFGLEAGWIFAPDSHPPQPFVEWMLRGQATVDHWRDHLTTLFPEVRPRGHLEVRCIDALPPEWCAAPLAVVAGLLADDRALRDAAEIVGAPDPELLHDAARQGLHDPRLGRGARELYGLALHAGQRTGVLEGKALEVARAYFETYTARGRAPADEAVAAVA